MRILFQRKLIEENVGKALLGDMSLELSYQTSGYSVVSRVLLKGSAASGRIEARQFEWCKEKCIRYIKAVKRMGSYVGLIICTVYFSETA